MTTPDIDRVNNARNPWLSLRALALGAFAIGCTEFMIVGLLPQIAGDLKVSRAGWGSRSP